MARVPAKVSRRVKDDENLLFRSEALVVTSRRVLFKTRSYVASAITSVKVQEHKDAEQARGGISGAVIGVIFLLGGAGLAARVHAGNGQRAPAVLPIFIGLGVLIAVLGLLMFRHGGRTAGQQDPALRFAVLFTTTDGHKERITGLTRPVAEKIAAAISDASAGAQGGKGAQSEAG